MLICLPCLRCYCCWVSIWYQKIRLSKGTCFILTGSRNWGGFFGCFFKLPSSIPRISWIFNFFKKSCKRAMILLCNSTCITCTFSTQTTLYSDTLSGHFIFHLFITHTHEHTHAQCRPSRAKKLCQPPASPMIKWNGPHMTITNKWQQHGGIFTVCVGLRKTHQPKISCPQHGYAQKQTPTMG